MITLASIFSDGMVLQAEKPVRLFGRGIGKITAICGGDEATTNADEDGRFLINLPAHRYSDVAEITVSDAEGSRILHRVLFGDVYLFSGQSNMGFTLREAKPYGELLASDDIRVYSTDTALDTARFKPKHGWICLNRETAPDFSAIACLTAGELYQRKKRPIGIIIVQQGASVIQSWLSPKALAELDLHFLPSELFHDHFEENFAVFNQDSYLYRLALAPLFPLSLAAVIWYQGESNCSDAEAAVYDQYLTKLIDSWRREFGDGNLPFVIVQIADFIGRDFDAWHEIQRKQELVAMTAPHCRLAISRDVCENDEIHPPTKHLLSRRIAELLS